MQIDQCRTQNGGLRVEDTDPAEQQSRTLALLFRPAGCILHSAILLCLLSSPAFAQDLPTTNPTTNSSAVDATGPDVNDTAPILSTQATWAGAVVIGVLGLFFAAAVIGPVVIAESPQTVPDAFSHHEDPSHHTGRESDAVPLPPGQDDQPV